MTCYRVLNGDLITGESKSILHVSYATPVADSIALIDTFKSNSTKLIDEIMAPLNEAGVKHSSTYGVSRFFSCLKVVTRDIMLITRTTITRQTSLILKRFSVSY